MNPANTSAGTKSGAIALRVQACLAGAALLAALTPRPGAAALYVPLAPHAALPIGERGLIPLARGPLPDSVFVRTTGASASLSALGQGALLVAAPDPSCSPPPQTIQNRTSSIERIENEDNRR